MTELTNERDVPELLPCPFCGGTDTFIERLDYSAAYVQCDSQIDEHCACLMRGPVGVQDNDGEEIPGAAAAARAWNRRATPSSDCALPPLPEPHWTKTQSYTAEQVEQIRREAVEALQAELAATQASLETAVQAAWTANAALSETKAQLARQSQEPQGQAERASASQSGGAVSAGPGSIRPAPGEAKPPVERRRYPESGLE